MPEASNRKREHQRIAGSERATHLRHTDGRPHRLPLSSDFLLRIHPATSEVERRCSIVPDDHVDRKPGDVRGALKRDAVRLESDNCATQIRIRPVPRTRTDQNRESDDATYQANLGHAAFASHTEHLL